MNQLLEVFNQIINKHSKVGLDIINNNNFISMKLIILVLMIFSVTINLNNYEGLAALNDAPVFSLDGNTYIGKVRDIYDGDTCKIIIQLCNDFKKFSFRLSGIDTPEMRGTFKEFGKEVRDILRGMIDQKLIKVDALESDKYGRILGVLYGWTTDNEVININQYLVDHAMAKAYDGGTKEAFTQADYDYFINNFRNTVWPTFVNYPNTL